MLHFDLGKSRLTEKGGISCNVLEVGWFTKRAFVVRDYNLTTGTL